MAIQLAVFKDLGSILSQRLQTQRIFFFFRRKEHQREKVLLVVLYLSLQDVVSVTTDEFSKIDLNSTNVEKLVRVIACDYLLITTGCELHPGERTAYCASWERFQGCVAQFCCKRRSICSTRVTIPCFYLVFTLILISFIGKAKSQAEKVCRKETTPKKVVEIRVRHPYPFCRWYQQKKWIQFLKNGWPKKDQRLLPQQLRKDIFSVLLLSTR